MLLWWVYTPVVCHRNPVQNRCRVLKRNKLKSHIPKRINIKQRVNEPSAYILDKFGCRPVWNIATKDVRVMISSQCTQIVINRYDAILLQSDEHFLILSLRFGHVFAQLPRWYYFDKNDTRIHSYTDRKHSCLFYLSY